MSMYAFVIAAILFGPPGPIERLLDAVEYVESRYNTRAIGDGGRSKGCLQISRAAWQDACEYGRVRWDYDRLVWSRWHSWQVARWYWQRWCPRAYKRADYEVLARIWNGGPRGASKARTLAYWARAEKVLRQCDSLR